uniref:Protease Do-like PDZ domain-containing protein n=1 Tax=Physcomitrium patens TaxID=3218 RepID=A0A2K1JZL9_PHYPA|nr:hypothetical protein PHYPA_014094 [Physcomitrium patens]
MYPLLMTEEAMVIHMFDYNVHGFVRSQGVRSEPVTIRYHLTPTSNDFVQLQHLVPIHQFGMLLRHYILADLAFIPLTEPYLQEYVKDFYNTSPRRLTQMSKPVAFLTCAFIATTTGQFYIACRRSLHEMVPLYVFLLSMCVHGNCSGQKKFTLTVISLHCSHR